MMGCGWVRNGNKGRTKSREEFAVFSFSFPSPFEQLFDGGISGILRGTRLLDEFSLRASSILRLSLFPCVLLFVQVFASVHVL